jgi:hypothetical protein
MQHKRVFCLFLASTGFILPEIPYQTYLQKYNYFQRAKGVISLLARI